jgi:hypothetical protein
LVAEELVGFVWLLPGIETDIMTNTAWPIQKGLKDLFIFLVRVVKSKCPNSVEGI